MLNADIYKRSHKFNLKVPKNTVSIQVCLTKDQNLTGNKLANNNYGWVSDLNYGLSDGSHGVRRDSQ